VAAITAHGHPAWLVEAMLSHDTFSLDGRLAFQNIPFLAPEGFAERVDFPVLPLLPPPEAWGNELEVLRVDGNKAYGEHVFFHSRSRTLVVADLAFNFGGDEPVWTGLLLKTAVGSSHAPGMSRPFKYAIDDEAAFRASMARMMAWDFDRVIVGHGDVIPSDGRARIGAMLQQAGF
jgi:hypothetical protein